MGSERVLLSIVMQSEFIAVHYQFHSLKVMDGQHGAGAKRNFLF